MLLCGLSWVLSAYKNCAWCWEYSTPSVNAGCHEVGVGDPIVNKKEKNIDQEITQSMENCICPNICGWDLQGTVTTSRRALIQSGRCERQVCPRKWQFPKLTWEHITLHVFIGSISCLSSPLLWNSDFFSPFIDPCPFTSWAHPIALHKLLARGFLQKLTPVASDLLCKRILKHSGQ